MSRRAGALAALGIGLALLVSYVVLWSRVDHGDVNRSDFTASYLGGALWREGHRADLYEPSVQAPRHRELVSPRGGGLLPFTFAPSAAPVAAALSLLSLDAAYRLWGLVQLAMVIAAALIAARVAARPPDRQVLAVAIAGAAGVGTAVLLVLGQWDGLGALGMAAGYALWRRGRPLPAGALLMVLTGLAKPHLAIGLGLFILACRDRRLIAGAALGAVALLCLWVAAVGPAGIDDFLRSAPSLSTGAQPTGDLENWQGFAASWFGGGAVPAALALAATLGALAGCAVAGELKRRGRALEPALAAAVILSLLAAPHLLLHDLVLLAPVLAWLAAWAATVDDGEWPGCLTSRVLVGWTIMNLLMALDLGSHALPGRVVAPGLAACGALLLAATRYRSIDESVRSAEHIDATAQSR